MLNGSAQYYVRAALFLFIAVLLTSPSMALPEAKGKGPTGILDQQSIHALYTEGEFEAVVAAIDSFTQANKTYSFGDSVFIAKHLAVIYTANPATREKGKNYMFRLLSLLPSAKIVDMFISDEIDHIFERVREEYAIKSNTAAKRPPIQPESNENAAQKMKMETASKHQPGKRSQVASEKSSSHMVFWVAGGVTAAAVATYYFLQSDKPTDKNYVVPDP